MSINSPCGRGVAYARRIHACRMRRLKWCPDGSTSTAWGYASLLFNLYRDAGPKLCQCSQYSRAQTPLNPFYTCCNLLLTGLHHSPPPPLKFFHIHLPSPTCTSVKGKDHHQTFEFRFFNLQIIVSL